MGFPQRRLRRLRTKAGLRSMVRETRLSPSDLIYPLFVTHGQGLRRPIPSMPGIAQLSIDELIAEAEEAFRLGVPAVLLFGIPQHKDPIGEENFDPEGIIPQALRALRKALPELILITDVCLCEYTDHGHCFIIRDGAFDNDATLEVLGKVAVAHAEAGADLVAPSGMVDGMVGAIRQALDAAGYPMTGILSYAVKYASQLYGPFREAAESAPSFGDRKGYQMDPANAREALEEARLDVEEGADLLMVKPGLPYLDVLAELRRRFNLPLAAYQVSGEYSMLKAAALQGWLDERRTALELLTSFKRAGADLILTYYAKEAARWLREEA